MSAHRNWFRDAVRNRSGMSAIEFSLILPIMLTMYFGVVELGNALTINRRTSIVASTAADLVAQEKTTSTTGLQDAFKASKSILTPIDTAPLKIVLTSVVADANNAGKVDWSCATGAGATPRAKNSNYTVPVGLTQPNNSVIVAEVTYAYAPIIGSSFFNPGSYDMKRTFYARPRKSLVVTKTDTGC
jgi:Flp pilus assembly protein TadG